MWGGGVGAGQGSAGHRAPVSDHEAVSSVGEDCTPIHAGPRGRVNGAFGGHRRCTDIAPIWHRRLSVGLPAANLSAAGWAHAAIPPPPRARRDDLLHGDARHAGDRPLGARGRAVAGGGCGDAGRAAVRDRRLGGVAGSSALRLDAAGGRCGVFGPVGGDQGAVFTRVAQRVDTGEPPKFDNCGSDARGFAGGRSRIFNALGIGGCRFRRIPCSYMPI